MDLRGTFTALVTPFANGEVCYDTLKALVARQIEAGVDGLVPVGTTGESPTLDVSEHLKVIETVIETAAGKVPVIAGTGANAAAEAVELTMAAERVGADATLQVTPYYNKPTPEGLYAHFSKVADVGLPVVLYNIPGRCGVEIPLDITARLAAHPNIVALKEAGGKAIRVTEVRRQCELNVLSGDDNLTLPMMALGGTGVISVASNLMPAEVTRLTHLALDGQWAAAREQHENLYDLFRLVFLETNPIPIKAAMAAAGLLTEEYRLPLLGPRQSSRSRMLEILKGYGIGT